MWGILKQDIIYTPAAAVASGTVHGQASVAEGTGLLEHPNPGYVTAVWPPEDAQSCRHVLACCLLVTSMLSM